MQTQSLTTELIQASLETIKRDIEELKVIKNKNEENKETIKLVLSELIDGTNIKLVSPKIFKLLNNVLSNL